MRIDKYIWAIRLFKTRSLASKACIGEKVKLNGDFIKSSKIVKKNDVVVEREALPYFSPGRPEEGGRRGGSWE